MTAPTPEQMRALADEHKSKPLDQVAWEIGARAALRAAADEVDRLRAAESRAYVERAQALVSLGTQIQANAHLRAVIENAPHEEPRDGDDGYGCQINPCTCWKADVL